MLVVIYRFTLILYWLFLCGCEFTQPVLPPEPIDTADIATPVPQKNQKNLNSNSAKSSDTKTKLNMGQNPDKIFNDTQFPPVRGKAKLEFPSENLLD